MKSMIIENILLEFRYFLDDALTLIEFYEASEREPNIKFTTSNEEIGKLRSSFKKFVNLTFELKTQIGYYFVHEFNSSLEYSQNFKRKRKCFFNTMFKRLSVLEYNLKMIDCKKEILKIYFKNIQKLIKKITDFIAYIESDRWHKSIAIEILDQISFTSSKLPCVFDKFFDLVNFGNELSQIKNEYMKQIKDSSFIRKKGIKSLTKNFTSSFLNSPKSKITQYIDITKMIRYFLKITLIIIFFLIVVTSFFSTSSNHYTIDFKKAYKINYQYSNLINKKLDFLTDISLDNFFNLFVNKKIDTSLKTNTWDQIFSYMKEFYVVFISFTAFLSLEFFIK